VLEDQQILEDQVVVDLQVALAHQVLIVEIPQLEMEHQVKVIQEELEDHLLVRQVVVAVELVELVVMGLLVDHHLLVELVEQDLIHGQEILH
tara:strand:- start:40 stop:315 length:276 start_codon:yes stop_codon:yes gene_type:complete